MRYDGSEPPRPRARRGDPETAREAARSLSKKFLSDLDSRIVDYLERYGARTSREVADGINWERQSVSPRFRILEEAGYVVEHGRRKNRSGVSALAWRAAAVGETSLTRPRYTPDATLLDLLDPVLFDGLCDDCWRKIPKALRDKLRERGERRKKKKRRAGMSS